MLPALLGIDHIHLYVPNKKEAVNWYRDNLNFHIVEELESWNTPGGPLTIADESNQIHLALFEREEFTPSTAIAFKTTGNGFLAWKTHLEKLNILERCTNHHLAWSVYFRDPWGNFHEITTYDTEVVKSQL